MKHTLSGGRPGVCIVDISVDENVEGRDVAVSDVVSHIAAPWQDNMLANMTGNVTFTGGHYIDLDSLNGQTGDFGPAAGHPTTGAIVGTPYLQPATAYLIHKASGSHRGTRNGRMFVPGLAESEVDEAGVVQASRVSSWNTKLALFKTACQNLFTSALDGSTAWRTVHVNKAGSPDPSLWTWSSSTITSAFCDVKVATQRRRLRG